MTYKNFGKSLEQEKIGCLWQEIVGRLINESAFFALNYVTWPNRNIVENPRAVNSSRKISDYSLFSTNFKSYKYVFFSNVHTMENPKTRI